MNVASLNRRIKSHGLEVITAFCLFSNLYSYTFPLWLYYAGLVLMAFRFLRSNVHYYPKHTLYVWLFIVILASSVINFAVDVRLGIFAAILALSTPAFSSPEWHQYKVRLLKTIFVGFAVTVVVSEYAYHMGINYQVIYNMMGIGMEDTAYDEFSGFARHPMWNSAAAAMSAIFFAFLYFRNEYKKKWVGWFYLFMFAASIHITLLSASRAAFASSMVASVLLLFWVSSHPRLIIQRALIIGVLGYALYPFFSHSATRMMVKQETQTESGETSRSKLWAQRKREFLSSPVYGVGFGVHGTGLRAKVGRNESGSGWFSVLAQSGIIGFVLLLTVWFRAWSPARRLRHDSWYLLFLAAFVFFSVHSVVEGYMYQGGWYMCVICWMVVGVLSEEKYEKYSQRLTREKTMKT